MHERVLHSVPQGPNRCADSLLVLPASVQSGGYRQSVSPSELTGLRASSAIQYQFPIVSTATSVPGSQSSKKAFSAPSLCGILPSRRTSRASPLNECPRVLRVRIERDTLHRAPPCGDCRFHSPAGHSTAGKGSTLSRHQLIHEQAAATEARAPRPNCRMPTGRSALPSVIDCDTSPLKRLDRLHGGRFRREIKRVLLQAEHGEIRQTRQRRDVHNTVRAQIELCEAGQAR
jgi:hypothetical protein